jgi:hypothetical protein
VQNGSPGAFAVICYSRHGSGPFSVGNGITLDLSMPIGNIGPFSLDSMGNGTLGPFPVPSIAVYGMQVWFQGVQFDMWANPIYSVTNMVPVIVGAVGALASWGRDNYGQVSNTPTANDFIQVSAGWHHSVALKL